jgi:valyl-tRNA synthetase
MSELEDRKRYEPAEVEPRIVERWLESGLFSPEPEGTAADNYSIAIPPPNVTGALHMGHALNNSVQDCLARHHRMRGQRTKWILGTDHAGIATQAQVEKSLISEGTNRRALGRDAFVERVWEWRSQYGGTIVEQLKRLGALPDYRAERFTLDAEYAEAVLKVFVALYEKGYIYRDRYMVNWDPGSGSAISDLEVEQHDVTDTLYYIDYPLVSGSGSITVATVRPETMLADTAIAVNPEDDRYRRLIGEKAILPLVGRKLRIIADDYVKPEFGTGALKITPAHDPNDFEIGRRHGLAQPSVIGEDGRMTDEAPERFRGLTVTDAQREVVAALNEQGLIARTEPYHHTVPFSQRSGARIEPLISLQWFMAMDELAKPAIEAVTSGHVTFHPENYTKVYLDWMRNIRPWCISRQLWWGHQLPVWYRDLETYVGETPPRGDGWTRDPDVLDTWFSSALWPFATLGWPHQTPSLRAFYPTDALVTARDIIFHWVARMIMMGLEFTGTEPFSEVYVHSVIQAPDGRRMSKSLGTGIDPLDLINGGPRPPVFGEGGEFPAYGADAVRWGLLAMSSGQDVRFSEERIAQGQQLGNKLWNAARLVLLSADAQARAAPIPTAVEDRWILSRLARAQAEVTRQLDAFDFSQAALALYDFVYGELCDWYLELVKPRLRASEPELIGTLLYVLTETISLAHPIIPFETEEIWSLIPGSEGLLAQRVVPALSGAAGGAVPGGGGAAGGATEDADAEVAVERTIAAIQALRRWRDGAEVKAGAMLPARLVAPGYEQTAEHLARLARLSLNGDAPDEAQTPVATVPVPGGVVEILGGAGLDRDAAIAKLRGRIDEIRAELTRAQGKLANQGFVAKAPPRVVQAERDKVRELTGELERLRDELRALGEDADG